MFYYDAMRDMLIEYIANQEDKDLAFFHVLLGVEMAAINRQQNEPATSDAWIKWRDRAEAVAELRRKWER